MTSVFDVPAHLALILSLAASSAANVPLSTPADDPAGRESTLVLEPLEGPFRFSESSWLQALKEGDVKDEAIDAARIFRTSGGRYYLPAALERRRVLEKRNDGALAGRVARAFAVRNAQALQVALRRRPSTGELYIAHVFGSEAAAGFIRLVADKPAEAAVRHLPELARSAPDLLAERGVPLTLAEVYKRLTDPLQQSAPTVGALAPEPKKQKGALLYFKPTLGVSLRRTALGSPSQKAFWRTRVSAGLDAAPLQ